MRNFTVKAISPLLGVLVLGSAVPAYGSPLRFQDPKGDDNGWGTATYPTGGDYTPGAFDLIGLEIREDGDYVVFEVELAKSVTDPWNSDDWGGNGFSLQFVQVYIDTDGKRRKGEKKGVPGSWVEFESSSYWEKVVLISPQPASKLKGEINAKAPYLKKRIIIPDRTEPRGKKLIARVSVKALGGKPTKKWGVQALVLSNEGYPAAEDLMARRVNEIAGEHRFGGGCDGFGDPQIIDMLTGSAKGAAEEVKLQHDLLAKFTCSEEPKKAKLARIPVVRL